MRALIDEARGAVRTLAGIGDVLDLETAVASPLAFEGAEVLVSGLVDEVDVEAAAARADLEAAEFALVDLG